MRCRPFPFGVVERLLGIEQITLFDSQSFRGKASKRRHGRRRKESEKESEEEEEGVEFIRNSWRSADGPVKTSNIRPSNVFPVNFRGV